jgi:DNA processing protein
MPTILRSSHLFPQSLKIATPKIPLLHTSGVRKLGTTGQIFSGKLLTVVGSRKMTRYGEQVVKKLIPPLVQAGVVIVSGFMYGVDQAAHRACLDSGGFTIAVLGWGITWPVLPVEKALYNEIKQQGLFISEYPGKTKPQLWMFPARDRVMAALGQATLVIEAAKKSGSLITARYAKQFKRKLFAVPGPITSTVSGGTNMLIKSGQALAVESASEILAIMSWPQTSQTSPRGCFGATGGSKTLKNLLAREPLSVDELAQQAKKSINKLNAELSVLQLQGVVEEKNGKFYLSQNQQC